MPAGTAYARDKIAAATNNSLFDNRDGQAGIHLARTATTAGKSPVTRSNRDRLRPRNFELVAEAPERLDIEARREVRLDLAPQPLDVDIDRFRCADEVVTPGDSHQLVAAQHPVGVLHQGVEQGELTWGQRDPLAVH